MQISFNPRHATWRLCTCVSLRVLDSNQRLQGMNLVRSLSSNPQCRAFTLKSRKSHLVSHTSFSVYSQPSIYYLYDPFVIMSTKKAFMFKSIFMRPLIIIGTITFLPTWRNVIKPNGTEDGIRTHTVQLLKLLPPAVGLPRHMPITRHNKYQHWHHYFLLE